MHKEIHRKNERRRAWCFLLIGGSLAVICEPAYSHLRWFVEDSSHADTRFSIDTYTVAILVGGLVYLVLALIVDAHPRSGALVRQISPANFVTAESAWRAIAVLFGIMLLAFAASDVFLAPNLILAEPFGLAGRIAQTVLGVLLISQLSLVVCGVMAIAAFLFAVTQFPPILMVDYVFEYAALGLSLVFIGPSLNRWDRLISDRVAIDFDSLRAFAVPSVRIGLGLSLMVLAIHNKLLDPGLGLAFQGEHDFNFMPWLGFDDFSNLHFVLAAGVTEFIFGLLLVTGVATRFTAFSVGAFFVTTLIALGPIELIGHAPLFGIILLLIIEGDGGLRIRAFGAPTQSSNPSE